MKFLESILAMFLMLTLVFACKKSGTADDPKPTVELTGTWHIQYYIAANIVIGGPDRNDTMYAEHNETWTFKGDSLFTDVWFATSYDLTKNPPTFSTSDTSEIKAGYSYTRNGNHLIFKSPGGSENADIINLTNAQLLIHEEIDPIHGFNDLYINFTK